MLTIAFLLGLRAKPAPERQLVRERDQKRAELQRLRASIAERDAG